MSRNSIYNATARLKGFLEKRRERGVRSASSVTGYIDALDSNYVSGWAYAHGSVPVVVEVFIDDQLVAKGIAQGFRQDIVAKTAQREGHCAFHILVPSELQDVKPSRLSVKANGYELPWADDATRTPLNAQLPDEEVTPVAGMIDAIGSNYINGWAYGNLNIPVVVEVFIDGQLVAKGLADDFRPDLAEVGAKRKGHCAFHILVPFDLQYVERSRLSVKGNGIELPLSLKATLIPSNTESLDDEFLPVDLPVPSPELVYLVNGHRETSAFAASRRATTLKMRAMLSENGITLASFKNILDFGCGAGRILAGWQHMLSENTHLYGVDINEQLVAFCQESIPFAKCSVSPYMPPLPYESGLFDFIYAGSVFTHLSEAASIAWGNEFSRLARNGAIVMVSYHGSFYSKVLANLSKSGCMQLEERGIYAHLCDVDEEDIWLGHNAYATFTTSSYVRSLFPNFELIKVYPGVSHGPNPFASYQDIALLRRTLGHPVRGRLMASEQWVPTPAPGYDCLFMIDEVRVADRSISIRGWVLSEPKIKWVRFLHNGVAVGEVEPNELRLDVYRGTPSYNDRNSGFEFEWTALMLPDGQQVIAAHVIDNAGNVVARYAKTYHFVSDVASGN